MRVLILFCLAMLGRDAIAVEQKPESKAQHLKPVSERRSAMAKCVEAGRRVAETPSERAVYVYEGANGRKIDYEFEALILNRSRRPYVGLKHDTYIVTSRGAFGVSISLHSLAYSPSRIAELRGERPSVRDLWAELDATGATFEHPKSWQSVGLSRPLLSLFSDGRSDIMKIRITDIAVERDQLVLSLQNFSGRHSATVVLDTAADPWKLVKVTLDGKEVDISSAGEGPRKK